MNTESLSRAERTVVLARLAHELTICGRTTYEVGTENVLEPQVLRADPNRLFRTVDSAAVPSWVGRLDSNDKPPRSKANTYESSRRVNLDSIGSGTTFRCRQPALPPGVRWRFLPYFG
jgi:hypothetical protein